MYMSGKSYSSQTCLISTFLEQQITLPLLSTLKHTQATTEDNVQPALERCTAYAYRKQSYNNGTNCIAFW